MTNVRNTVEIWFASFARIIYRNRIKTLLIMAVLIAAITTQLPKLTIDISMEGFLHKTDPTLIEYNDFVTSSAGTRLLLSRSVLRRSSRAAFLKN